MSDALGGSEIQCDIIATKLQEYGNEVIYIALNGDQKYNTTYRVISISNNAGKVASECIKVKPDIVYWRNNKHKLLATVRRIKKANIPIVFAGSSFNDSNRWNHIRKRTNNKPFLKYIIGELYKILIDQINYNGFKWVDGVIVNNKDYLNKIKVQPQVYIPNSMKTNLELFIYERPYLCWVSNIKPIKRPELFVELARRLIDVDIDFIMIGSIQDESYKWLLDKKFLPDNLYYLGPKTIEQVNGILNKTIALCHTCEPEGFSNNFIQAWLQSKPVISYEFDPGGLIRSQKLGFVSDSDMDIFVKDVKSIITNSNLAEEIGSRAFKYSNINFNPDTNVKTLEKFLKDVIQNSIITE